MGEVQKKEILLSEEEKRVGFKEQTGSVNFFRKGEIHEWKKTLPKNLIRKIIIIILLAILQRIIIDYAKG